MTERRPLRFATQALMRARWIARRTLRRQLRIVIEIRWRLGDEIMAIPIYEGIKRRYPFCNLSVWCNHPDLLIRNPHVDQVHGPEQQPNFSECDRYVLLRGAPRDAFRLDHYARLAAIPTPPMNPRLYYEDWTASQLAEAGIKPKQFIAVSSGATWDTKEWPMANWQQLCRALANDGHTVVQVGHNDSRIEAVHDLVDRTTVRDVACVLRHAQLLVCNDSGLMHLALAVGTPVLGLFGPTNAAMLVRASTKLLAMTNGRNCQGCWNSPTVQMTEGTCPLNISSCMETLTVDSVLEGARELLGHAA